MEEKPAAPMTLTEKIKLLFATVKDPDTKAEYSSVFVEARLKELGYKVSDSLLNNLRNGQQVNPTHNTLEALAKFFKVNPAYFFDDNDEGDKIRRQMLDLNQMERLGVKNISMRLLSLDPNRQTAVVALISQMLDTIDAKPDPNGPDSGSPETAP
jgi:transcriptional regulator with XRE-family HTH domain